MFNRHPNNPLITPRAVVPSRPDFEVIGTFNAGVTEIDGQTLLLLRVAERFVQTDPQNVLIPLMDAHGKIDVRVIPRSDPRYDVSDSRLVIDRSTRQVLLTSISHLRRAYSRDGIHFTVDKQPWLTGSGPYETYGVEDPRITRIDDTYYVNYTAVSGYGIATALVATRDFKTIERHGVIFPPDNRDAAIFPELINGQYVAYHRPMPGALGRLSIWITTSPDLHNWGSPQAVLDGHPGGWEGGRVGGGAPPLRTDRGWLSIYHAATADNHYCLGAFLTPLDEPGRVIARSQEPILSPTADYETAGFFPNVVFTCGALLHSDTLNIYYGAADGVIALAEAPVNDVIDSLTKV